MVDLILKDEVCAVIGAAIEVHRELGSGFLEPVYQEAMESELRSRGLPIESQRRLGITYKGQPLQKTYVADWVCYGQTIVEPKAPDDLSGKERAQLLNYLHATGLPAGLLVNFGSRGKLEWERFVN
jgi:GxxExxY protein